MVATINVLVTEVGEFAVPADMAAIYSASKIRKDGQPDRRTRSGKLWAEKFAAFKRDRIQEYLAQ